MQSFEPIAVGVVLVGDDGLVAEADAVARRLLGLDLSGIAAPRWRDLGLSASVHEPPAGQGLLVRRDGPDGSVRWFLLSKRPLRLAGEPLYVFSLADVSAIRNELDTYKGFFVNAVEGIFQSTPQGGSCPSTRPWPTSSATPIPRTWSRP
jgi:PAS domain-containing protein